MKEKYEMYEQHLARFRLQEGGLEDDQVDLEEQINQRRKTFFDFLSFF